MKHEETSLHTKKQLAASLKNQMASKPLHKITVSGLITDCGVNRKTFYYHFVDGYALLKWLLEQEAVQVVKGFDLLADPEKAIRFVMDYVDANKHILNCAYDSMGRDELKRFFYADFIALIRSLVDRVEQELALTVDVAFKTFLAEFYTEALAGMLIGYFHDQEARNREDTLRYILLILRSAIPGALASRAAER